MIKLTDDGNGGELAIKNNDLEPENTIGTQIYLCLFGGNLDEEWFGNLFYADDKLKQFSSNFEKALSNTVITSNSLLALKSALDTDLKILLDNKIVDKFNTKINVVSLNKIDVTIEAINNGGNSKYKVLFNKETNSLAWEII